MIGTARVARPGRLPGPGRRRDHADQGGAAPLHRQSRHPLHHGRGRRRLRHARRSRRRSTSLLRERRHDRARRGRQFQHLRHQADLRDAAGHDPDPDRGDGRGRGGQPDRRRHRHHEHHAGLGDRADARDRHPPRHRRGRARGAAAVPGRGGGARLPGRADRAAARARRVAGAGAADPGAVPVRPADQPDRVQRLGADRRRLRLFPGPPRGARSTRSTRCGTNSVARVLRRGDSCGHATGTSASTVAVPQEQAWRTTRPAAANDGPSTAVGPPARARASRRPRQRLRRRGTGAPGAGDRQSAAGSCAAQGPTSSPACLRVDRRRARRPSRRARGAVGRGARVRHAAGAARAAARLDLRPRRRCGMLALALGLNTTVFTVMDAMLFRGFPQVTRNHELVFLQERDRARPVLPLVRGRRGVARAGAVVPGPGARRRRVDRLRVTAGAADGSARHHGRGQPVRAARRAAGAGRDFTPADAVPGARPVVMLSTASGRRVRRRADVVGSLVQVDGRPAEIVGVMPEGFEFPMAATDGLWMPIVAHARTCCGAASRPAASPPSAGCATGSHCRRPAPNSRPSIAASSRAYPADEPRSGADGRRPRAVHERRRRAHHLGLAVGGVLAGAAHRLRQRRQPDAGAHRRPLARVRHLPGARRRAAADGPAEARWRAPGHRRCRGAGVGPDRWSVARWAAIAESRYQVVDYSVTAGTLDLPRRRVGRRRAPVAGARRARAASERGRHVEGGCARRHPRAPHAAPGHRAGGRPDGAGRRAAGRSRRAVRSFANIVGAETGVRQARVGAGRAGCGCRPRHIRRRESRLAYFDRVETRLRAVAGVERTALSGGCR